jgi:hypothetical protein
MIKELSAKAVSIAQSERGSPSSSHEADSSSRQLNRELSMPKYRSIKHNACDTGSCVCHCHTVLPAESRGRWGVLTRPTFSALTTKCSCPTRKYKFALSISQNIMCINLLLSWIRGFTVQPTLKIPCRARDTSPGFVILWKCEYSNMLLDQARKELKHLLRSGHASIHDVDSKNQGWLEVSRFSSNNWAKHGTSILETS